MHAPKDVGLTPLSPGLIAGGGDLPGALVAQWEADGLAPVIAGIEGVTSPALLKGREHAVFPIGAAGGIIAYLKERRVRDLVLAGSVKRPDWSAVGADARGLSIILKVALRALGDDALLRVLRAELESEGFVLHGVQDYLPGLLAPAGILTATHPSAAAEEDIHLGFMAAKALGREDKGQAVAVQQGGILGHETAEGTKALIALCGRTKKEGQGPILVKVSKPQQDMALDAPTIGPETIRQAAEAGFSGVAVEAGRTLILDRETVVELANLHGLFLSGKKGEAK